MSISGPLVRLVAVQAPPPSLQDNTGDLDRLLRALAPELPGPIRVPFPLLGPVAARFRLAGFKGTAVVNDLATGPELADFLPAPPPVLLPLMALDLGTTYLEASLVDGLSGKVLARGHEENAQGRHGADILSRIHFAASAGGLASLHQDVIGSVDRLAGALADQAGLAAADIRALAVSGNTTMVHFFLRLDPYHLIREPYIPLVNGPGPCRAAELGLGLHPAAVVWLMPGVGSYFGGDLVSGIVATGLDEQEETAMLIDVGTNAEVVVGNREWLIACAGAAGPALEGGVARMGMRAGPGAIEHVTVDPVTGEPSWTTIGGAPPQGICGSGMIDLVAGLYLARVIDLRGRLRPEGPGSRLVETADGLAYVVAEAAAGAGGQPVLLHQTDLDALMRSKAAMYAILTTLIGQVGLRFEDLDRICVAGAFGRHIAPRQAIVLGMLPDLPETVYRPVGNSSLAGAERALLDRRARERCLEVVRRITYLELNVNQEFMIRFSGSRFIPHTDPRLFPSVPVFER
ncbi:MAG: ASKHA domain-containing protein [Desulfobacteraceae bacterium]|nr:ASKHA domain-containing protein [Desulfobacteraceae bacterium]